MKNFAALLLCILTCFGSIEAEGAAAGNQATYYREAAHIAALAVGTGGLTIELNKIWEGEMPNLSMLGASAGFAIWGGMNVAADHCIRSPVRRLGIRRMGTDFGLFAAAAGVLGGMWPTSLFQEASAPQSGFDDGFSEGEFPGKAHGRALQTTEVSSTNVWESALGAATANLPDYLEKGFVVYVVLRSRYLICCGPRGWCRRAPLENYFRHPRGVRSALDIYSTLKGRVVDALEKLHPDSFSDIDGTTAEKLNQVSLEANFMNPTARRIVIQAGSSDEPLSDSTVTDLQRFIETYQLREKVFPFEEGFRFQGRKQRDHFLELLRLWGISPEFSAEEMSDILKLFEDGGFMMVKANPTTFARFGWGFSDAGLRRAEIWRFQLGEPGKEPGDIPEAEIRALALHAPRLMPKIHRAQDGRRARRMSMPAPGDDFPVAVGGPLALPAVAVGTAAAADDDDSAAAGIRTARSMFVARSAGDDDDEGDDDDDDGRGVPTAHSAAEALAEPVAATAAHMERATAASGQGSVPAEMV